MKILVALCMLGLSMAFTVERQQTIGDESWHLWKGRHGKLYTDFNEEKVRYNIWKDNLQRIVSHNMQKKGFTLKMNHFGDMTSSGLVGIKEYQSKEAMKQFRLMKTSAKQHQYLRFHDWLKDIPDSIDWRDYGCVLPVHDQGSLGRSCPLVAIDSLTGRLCLPLVRLSIQQLLDCNEGCNGGLMDNAYKYVQRVGGIESEDSYPYVGMMKGACKFNSSAVAAKVTDVVEVETGNEDDLKKAVARGVVSVAVDASHSSFQFYSSGVYNEENCTNQLDHAMTIVGYGTENGKDYWLVKNSWGTNWGMGGYIKMSRNRNNQCGIATSASYPIVKPVTRN